MTYKKSILFILCNGVSDFRMTLAARELARQGYETEIMSAVPYYTLTHYDLIICCRPGMQMCDYLETATRAGVPVVVDMDDDFYHIPSTNPAYKIIGAGAGPYHQALKKTLKAMPYRTFASPVLVERYELPGVIVPNCFDETNPNWSAPRLKLPHQQPGDIVFGWAGSTTHLEDFELLRPALVNAIRQNENVRVMIGGDPAIYDLLKGVPEDKKLFMPGLPYDIYPIMHRYCDYWLAPLEDNFFNRAKSDIKLLEAGARGIPWLASRLPQYEDWGDGGWVIKPNEWEEAIEGALADGPKVRNEIGQKGQTKAQTRTSAEISKIWLGLVREVIG